MKCPFELPLEVYYSTMGEMWLVKDGKGNIIWHQLTEQQADYIVHAINSHEKLVETLRNVSTSLAITMLPKLDENVASNDEIIKIAISSLQQALKEAEKEQ